jgi:hypothetical protein
MHDKKAVVHHGVFMRKLLCTGTARDSGGHFDLFHRPQNELVTPVDRFDHSL